MYAKGVRYSCPPFFSVWHSSGFFSLSDVLNVFFSEFGY
jgi:hypothetical protein